MAAREDIARLWAAVCGADPERTAVDCWALDVDCGDADEVLPAAVVKASPGAGVGAFGVTDAEALAALWELVCLHARMRRDEINAALAAGGA